MSINKYQSLIADLSSEYLKHSPNSAGLQARAKESMVDGGSHNLRLTSPFPPRIKFAKGAYIYDEDGFKILDFWQGHFANILGHNPEEITSVLAHAFNDGFGLQSGFTDLLQIEVAELLSRQTSMEKVRLTTSGSLATMYAIMLAQAFTGREWILKINGGWHGGHPWGLKGVHFEAEDGYDHLESGGIPDLFGNKILLTPFNDPQLLSDLFKKFGGQLACFILEPVMGSGGFIPAAREYLQTARSLCDRYGVVLVLDEIISGFRFRAGDVGRLYGVKPDLITLGKIIGGGMPAAAVAGSQKMMELAAKGATGRVSFSGGTFSGHPASMLAAKTILNYLILHENEIYPRLAALGKLLRQELVQAFCSEGIAAGSTGVNSDLPDSSLCNLYFPYQADLRVNKAEDMADPKVCDLTLSKKVVPMALLLQDVFLLEGKGVVSSEHTETAIRTAGDACKAVARRIQQSR